METKAAGPGAFAGFDLTRVPSPCFVVDEAAVRRNLAMLKDVGDRGGAQVLLALKAFSMWSLADVVAEYLDGVCASGLWEARLAREFYRGHLTTYSPAYKRHDLPEILALSDSVIFNSPDQVARFADVIAAARAEGQVFDIGLRLNPEHSEAEVPKYDPCQRGHAWAFRCRSCGRSTSKASTACTSTPCASRASSRCSGSGRRWSPGSRGCWAA